MRLTNKYNLPEAIVRATKRQHSAYDKGPAHRSVTQLITPPRIDMLRKRHYADMETDVADEFWALLGSAVHHILEEGAESNQIVEERLYAEVDGWVISGALDSQMKIVGNRIRISDYKVTGAYNITGHQDGPKEEWVQQVNMQAYLVARNKAMPVESGEIIAIIRDWSAKKAQMDSLYPVSPIVPVHIPLWTFEEQEEYIRQRIALHRAAEMNAALGLPLPECGEPDRWERGHKWAVMKKGSKRAKKICDTSEEAEAILSSVDGTHFIEERPGEPTRCIGNYCRVSGWCEQWANDPRNPAYQPSGDDEKQTILSAG